MEMDRHKVWLIAIMVVAILAFGFLLIYPSLSDVEFVGQAIGDGEICTADAECSGKCRSPSVTGDKICCGGTSCNLNGACVVKGPHVGETGASSTKNICYYGTWKTEAQCLTLCQTAYSNCGEDVAYGEATQAECNTEFDECKQDTCGVSADADGDQIPDAQDECPNDASNTCNDPVELGGVCTSDAHCVGDLECAGGVCALYTCEDSDGTVSGIDSGDGMTFVEKTDGCVGVAGGTPTNVIDWSCDAAGYVSSEITSCSDGEICTGAGVCVSEDIDGDGVLDSVDMCPNLQTSVKQHTAGSSLGCIFGDSDNTGCLKSQEFLSMKYYYLNTDEAATVSCSATNAPADCLQSNEFLALKYYYLNTDDPSTVACS